MKKIFLVLLGLIFVFSFKIVKADVIINEVQVGGASADDEFIELYNSGSIAVDLTNWYLNKKSSTGHEDVLVSKSHFENKSIPSQGYFLLAKAIGYQGSVNPDTDWPNSYSLANNNSLILYDGNEINKDQMSWGSIENGKSIQRKTNGSWVVAIPTPKAENQISSNEENNDTQNVSSITFSSSDTSNENQNITKIIKTKTTEIPTMKAKILADNVTFVGQPAGFSANILGYANEKVVLGKLFWNFGDGSSLEQINKFEKIYHNYLYPGEYVVSLDYYQSSFSQEPEATNKINMKVVPLTVSISKVGDVKDFFVELTNNSAYDLDISNWSLNTNEKKFIFPKNTIIMTKKSITISGKTTGLVLSDKEFLKLNTSNGETVFYPGFSILQNKINNQIYKVSNRNNTTEAQTINNEVDINTESSDLTASAIDSNQNMIGNSRSLAFWGGLVILVGASSILVYFLRRKRVIKIAEDDFEILDE